MTRLNPTTAFMAVLSALNWTSAMAASVEANGATLHYVEEGKGSPIVFVHGLLADSRVWGEMRHVVARDHRVLAYDQRYHGKSTWDDDGTNFTIDAHASDLISFIEELETGPVALFTWSYGGQVGLQAIRQRPDLFRSAIHYEPDVESLQAGLPGAQAAARQFYASFAPAISAFQEGEFEQAAVELIDAVFQSDGRWSHPTRDDLNGIWRENSRTLPLAFSLDYPNTTCTDLEHLSVPTLVIQGAESWPHQSMTSEALARCLPQANILTLEGVSHDGPLHAPQKVGKAVAAFTSIYED